MRVGLGESLGLFSLMILSFLKGVDEGLGVRGGGWDGRDGEKECVPVAMSPG